MIYSNNKAEQTDSSLEDNTSTTSWNFDLWKELDPATIETRWVQREDSRPIIMSAAVSVNYVHMICLKYLLYIALFANGIMHIVSPIFSISSTNGFCAYDMSHLDFFLLPLIIATT